MRIPLALFLACLGVLMGPSTDVLADGHKFEVVDSDEIYYGEGKHPSTPAATEADDVWAEIPEYKRIVAEELDDDDPAYHILMRKATERFNKALNKLADRDDYDMIGETGSIKSIGDKENKIPDVTKELIKLVTRD